MSTDWSGLRDPGRHAIASPSISARNTASSGVARRTVGGILTIIMPSSAPYAIAVKAPPYGGLIGLPRRTPVGLPQGRRRQAENGDVGSPFQGAQNAAVLRGPLPLR